MRLLFVGDIVGRPGRQAVRGLLPQLVAFHKIDLVVANAENAAGGLGLTPPVARELLKAGIQLLTSGNHIWKKKEVLDYIQAEERLLRPANFPPGVPGRGVARLVTDAGGQIGVINLQGRVFMEAIDCPFRTAERELEALGGLRCLLVDFHAEATSEKMALGWFLDGRVSAVLGTHTHIQTADERILPGGTAYITDVGMTGPLDSVIGMKKELVLKRFITQLPQPFQVAAQEVELQGVVVDIDDGSGRAKGIERLRVKVP